MIICNFTPHTIVLAGPDGTVRSTHAPDPRGPARVAQLPATPLPGWWSVGALGPVDGPPEGSVPVVRAGGWGQIDGLPDRVGTDETLIVSLFCAQAGAAEAASIRDALARGHWPDSSPVLVEERPALQARLSVLGRLVCPGTGPADEPIRDEAGRVVAVTRLVQV